MVSKFCSKCAETKPIPEFTRDSSRADGLYLWCRACKRSDDAASYARRREQILPASRARYESDETYRDQKVASVRAYAEQNPEKKRAQRRASATPERTRAWMLKSKYGITPEDYERMFDEQGGVCASCGDQPASGKNLHVDHCHETNVVRGLLCNGCNVSLGHLKDDPDRIRQLADYAERHSALELVA